jgi:hypothetical protein
MEKKYRIRPTPSGYVVVISPEENGLDNSVRMRILEIAGVIEFGFRGRGCRITIEPAVMTCESRLKAILAAIVKILDAYYA